MASLCAFSPAYPAQSNHLPNHGHTATYADPGCFGASEGRPDFEENLSRAFQVLALRWLDDIFARYQKATAICSRNRITVPPISPQGFAVTLSTDGGRCRVLLGPSCEEFGSVAEATEYMTAAICGDLRLRVSLDRRPHRWTVERRLPDGSWIDDAAFETLPGAHPCSADNAWYFRNDPDGEN